MLLLLLQMNPIRVSHASWLMMRMPVNFGAFFLKFRSFRDHSSYNSAALCFKLK